MNISELYATHRPVVSLEIFPPKKDGDISSVYATLEKITDLKPDYISVTYGAGGTVANDATLEIASRIKNRHGVEPLAHLTCIASTKERVGQYLDAAAARGIRNILALRGDRPKGGALPEHPDFHYAADLIRTIRLSHPEFCIGAAAYPEGHVESESPEKDLEHLARKVDAGAQFLNCQLVFDNELFFRFWEKALARGIRVPISVGIMPILGRSQIEKMIFMCGASLPAAIIRILNRYENDPAGLFEAGLAYSAEQIRGLAEAGVDGIHIYTMNRPEIAACNMAVLGRC